MSLNATAFLDGDLGRGDLMTTRILVIDDDAGMRESLKEILSLEEIECEVTDIGRKGMAMYELHKPQLVVLDAQLPDVSGFQVCQMMKKDPANRRTPVVM